ncbi:hypothetical protein WR25_01799 [Diploscapter pachys]|uniref:Inhibitor of growth protein n=1 Tax=Diploscapter pachys TaxID=2018661 RepID=A0A2A2LTK2_9BILA|nr:hypothetical protein WR25_01799 [Diploscapter pachys]
MLFLDDFLEMLEELPSELKDRCMELRNLDAQVQVGKRRNEEAIAEFFRNSVNMTEEEKQQRHEQFQAEYRRLRSVAEEKVAIAERMKELLEKYVQHLEKEKTHFKYELEADNPGITEAIEKKFSEYVESVIAMRKERKRRHTSQTNGGTPSSSIHDGESSNSKVNKILNEGYSLLNGSSSNDLMSLENDQMMPMISASSSRSRLVLDEDSNQGIPNKRRNTGTRDHRGSVALPSPFSMKVDSPRSEKSWTPSNTEETSPITTSFASPFGSATMPAFVGPESRHGRPRKLTTRVQEMFKEAVQRQRHHQPVQHPENVEEQEGGEEDEDDSDDARRTWCFCNEKSYGDMVACDNKDCPYQWFHYPCVGITAPPRGQWFCPHCTSLGIAGDSATMSSNSNSNFY